MIWWTLYQLKSRDPRTRLKALQTLADQGGPSLAPHFITALSDPDHEVRCKAASELAQFKEEEQVVFTLISRLKDSHDDVRQTVVESLRQIGDRRAVEHLVPMLRDTSYKVRWRAANALDTLGWQPDDDTQFAFRAAALDKLELAASVGPAALDVLVGMLKDRSFPARHAVVEALSKIGDARVVKPLEAATRDQDSLVRKAAVDALSQTGDSRVVDTLLGMLMDREPKVRAAAVEALGHLGDVRALEPIIGLTKDLNWDVRILSVQALGKMHDKKACPTLIEALEDKDHDVRQAAAEALGLLQDSSAIKPLVLALKDDCSTVRQAVAYALRRLDRDWEKSEGAQQAMPELEAALSDKEYWVRQAAADALAKISDRRRTEPESTGFADAVQRKRNLALEALTNILQDADPIMRLAAAEALGKQGDTRAVEPLVSALRDEDQWVGRSCAAALRHLNWQPENRKPDQALQYVLLGEWQEAGRLGAVAVEPLVETLQGGDSARRQAAAKTLGGIGGMPATFALVTALSDKYRPVRRAAAASLRQLGWEPESTAQDVQLSIELGEWASLPEYGAAAVSPLLHALEDSAGDVDTLSACVGTLSLLIQNNAEEWSPEQLESILSIRDVLPIDASGQPTGADDPLVFDCAMLVQLAEQELAGRKAYS